MFGVGGGARDWRWCIGAGGGRGIGFGERWEGVYMGGVALLWEVSQHSNHFTVLEQQLLLTLF